MRFRCFRLTGLATVGTVAAAVIAGCGPANSAEGTSAHAPLVIGVSLSLTGGFSADGQAFERGYKLWQSDVNDHGGILGRRVRLIVLNDNSSPTTVVSNYRTLIKKDHVDLTLGPFSSLLSAPAELAVGKYGFAMICGACGANIVFYGSYAKYHNVFNPSLPVELYFDPFVAWLKSLPPGQRPKTAAYPSADDPFATPAVQTAQRKLQALGIRTVYSKVFPEKTSAYKAPAQQVAASGAQIVVLGATDVPTVAAFMSAFEQAHYVPKVFIAASGPDQGETFLGTVGKANANGVLVPDGWYGNYNNALNNYMVEQYIARYGGTAAGINADVAEAFSAGEVAADAVIATGGTNNAKIIRYLHSGVTLETVQGPARFNALGENPESAAFIAQWQPAGYVQVLPVGTPGSSRIMYPKPAWGA
jgi:branched-chain amino acid transport system substrate-binding protein